MTHQAMPFRTIGLPFWSIIWSFTVVRKGLPTGR